MTRRHGLWTAIWLLLLLPRPAAAALTVEGTVRATDGRALADARVDLLPLLDNYERGRALLAGTASPQPAASASTGTSGRYRLEVPSSGLWQVVVQAPGTVPMRYLPLPLVEATELPPVTLPRDVGSEVEILDGQGRPLPGIWVYAESSKVEATRKAWRRFQEDRWFPAARLARSNAEGKVIFPRLADEWLDFSLFTPWSAVPRRILEVEGLRIFLEPGEVRKHRLEVRAQSGSELPVGLLVCVGEMAWPVGILDENHRLDIPGTFSSPLEIQLMAAGGQVFREHLQPATDATSILLQPSKPLRGQVLAKARQTPLANALVWSGHDPGAFVTTGPEGEFELFASPSERSWMQAEAAGFLPRVRRVEQTPNLHLEKLSFKLRRPAAIAGRVVDEQGQPIAGALLSSISESSKKRPFFRLDRADSRATSDGEGRFLLRGLRTNTSYQIIAGGPTFVTTRRAVGGLDGASLDGASLDGASLDGATEPRTVEIVLPRNRAAFGHVLDLEERPLAGVLVRLLPAGSEADSTPSRTLHPSQPDDPFSVRSDSSGRFEFIGVPALRVDLLATGEGHAPLKVRGLGIAPGQGATNLGTLLMAPGVTLEGRVESAAGDPLADARVWVSEDPPLSARIALERQASYEADALSGSQGSFVLKDLTAEQPVNLVIHREGFLPKVLWDVLVLPEQEPERSELMVILTPASRVGGRIFDQDQQPIADAEMALSTVKPPAGRSEVIPQSAELNPVTRSNDQGVFELEGVAPGEYELNAYARGFVPLPPRRLTVSPGEDLDDLRLIAERGWALSGRVRTSEGEPVVGALLRAGRPTEKTDEHGFFRLQGLRLGTILVEAHHQDFPLWRREVEVEPRMVDLEVVLAAARPVKGRVMDEEGSPVRDARLLLRDVRGLKEFSSRSGERGDFHFPRVAAGRYQVHTEKRGLVAVDPTLLLEVANQPVTDLQVTMRPGASIKGRILGLEFDQLNTVQVQAESHHGTQAQARVDFGGHFEIPDLLPGDWHLWAETTGGTRRAEARVHITPADRQLERDLEFGGGLTVSGQVLFQANPLRQAQVTVVGHSVGVRRQVITDHQGWFRFRDLEPGRYRLGVTHAQEMILHNQDVEFHADDEVLIEVATNRVSGQVLSAADSQPLDAALVSLQQLLPGDRSEGGSLSIIGTDSTGFFSLARITEGKYRLTIKKAGYGPLEELLEVHPNTDLGNLRFLLKPTKGLDLRLRLASGEVPNHVVLTLLNPSGRRLITESRPLVGGVAHIPTVPAGDWTILVGAPGAAAQSVRVQVPGEPLDQILPNAGLLRVRVPTLLDSPQAFTLELVTQDGRPFQGLDLDTGSPVEQWWGTHGTVNVTGVPAGAWGLRVATSDGQVWTSEVVTAGAGEVEIELP